MESALAAVTEDAAEQYSDQLAAYLADVRRIVRERLMLYDSRSKRYYDEQRVEQEEWEFREGDPVILK